jgi:hypothetical protein
MFYIGGSRLKTLLSHPYDRYFIFGGLIVITEFPLTADGYESAVQWIRRHGHADKLEETPTLPCMTVIILANQLRNHPCGFDHQADSALQLQVHLLL